MPAWPSPPARSRSFDAAIGESSRRAVGTSRSAPASATLTFTTSGPPPRAEPLAVRVEGDADIGGPCLLDQIAVSVVGRAARHRSRDREPVAGRAPLDRGVRELHPGGFRRDRAVLVELGQPRRLPIRDR